MIYNDKEYKIINCNDEKKRSRYWSIIIYPDSAIDNWYDVLRDSGIKGALSPLHNRDKYDDKDEYKKAHYHLLIQFNYGARLSDVASICDSINAITHVQIVRNLEVMHDYLTHKNNLEKAQYNENDIRYINSTVYDYVNRAYKDILNYIDDYKCYSLHSLTWFLRVNNQDNLLEYVSKNTYYINEYIKSKDDKILAHIQNMMSICKSILDNIENNIEPDKKEIKTLKDTLNQYNNDYDGLPF